ncbi:MAG TPA: DoxX family membrane protein [Terriglobales bacterium]|nr:DoxX family membrane protein [Terriglobales bacterium]
MNKSQQPALILFVIGLLGLGILALIYDDFAMVWQPVPAGLPARVAVAYGSGVLMCLLGFGLLLHGARAWAVRILCPYLFIWAMLKVPGVLVAPKMEATWLGLGELLVLFAGGWTLFSRLGEIPPASPLAFLVGDRGVRMARILFAISVIPVGLSHIVYMKITAGYVPQWLPYREGWAVLTGAGQIASGLGVLFGVLPRIAAWAEAGQIFIYTFLVWLPAIVAEPKSRLNWTAFFISWIIASGAAAVAQNVAGKKQI